MTKSQCIVLWRFKAVVRVIKQTGRLIFVQNLGKGGKLRITHYPDLLKMYVPKRFGHKR